MGFSVFQVGSIIKNKYMNKAISLNKRATKKRVQDETE